MGNASDFFPPKCITKATKAYTTDSLPSDMKSGVILRNLWSYKLWGILRRDWGVKNHFCTESYANTPHPFLSLSCSHPRSVHPIPSSVHLQYSSMSPLTQGIGIKCLEKQSQHSVLSHGRHAVSIWDRISAFSFSKKCLCLMRRCSSTLSGFSLFLTLGGTVGKELWPIFGPWAQTIHNVMWLKDVCHYSPNCYRSGIGIVRFMITLQKKETKMFRKRERERATQRETGRENGETSKTVRHMIFAHVICTTRVPVGTKDCRTDNLNKPIQLAMSSFMPIAVTQWSIAHTESHKTQRALSFFSESVLSVLISSVQRACTVPNVHVLCPLKKAKTE